MTPETIQSPFPTSADNAPSINGKGSTVHHVAKKVHEAVDTLEERIGTSSDKLIGMQQEYGDMAREQVRASPLAAVGIAFAVGFVLAKITR